MYTHHTTTINKEIIYNLLLIIGSKGIKTIYGLKKLSVIPDTTFEKERNQILGALALTARASAFPPLNSSVANIVSLMVCEAIASVVLNLFKENNNVDDMMDKVEYLKGKVKI